MNINIVFLFSFVYVGTYGLHIVSGEQNCEQYVSAHATLCVPTSQPHPELVHPGDSDLDNSDLGIIGGDVAANGSAPYSVILSVVYDDDSIGTVYCGGSLITTRTVLTAAHCITIVWPPKNKTQTVLGTTGPRGFCGTVGTNLIMSGGQRYPFERGIIHEQFGWRTGRNDIGVLITVTKVVLSKLVQPISLGYDVIPGPGGIRSKVSGWGNIDNNHAGTNDLMELYLNTMDGETCAKKVPNSSNGYFNFTFDITTQLCAYNSSKRSICNGDSGSALVALDDSGAPRAQIGIVSWSPGSGCAQGYPDVYTKVSHYRDWLKKHVVE